MAGQIEIEETFTRLIFPFRLVDKSSGGAPLCSFQSIIPTSHQVEMPSRSGRSQFPLWAELPKKELVKLGRRLLPSIRQYLKGDRTQGYMWSESAHQLLSPNISIREGDSTYIFDLRTELILFDTMVGFLVFEVVPRRIIETDGGRRQFAVGDVVQLNYHLHHLYETSVEIRRWTSPRSVKHKLATETKDEGFWTRYRTGQAFRIIELINACLEPLGSQSIEHVSMTDPYLVGLSYLSIADTDAGQGSDALQQLAPWLFRLRRMYGRDYDGAPHLMRLDHNPEIVQSVERIIIGACAEGLSVVAIADPGTQFFSQLGELVRRGYFSLLILALHQRMALESIAFAATKLDTITDRHESSRVTAQVHALRTRAYDVVLHHMFPAVSLLTSYQQVYERLLLAYRVESVHQALRNDFTEIDELLASERQGAEVRQQNREERTKRHLEIALAVIAPLGLFLGFWSAHFAGLALGPPHSQGLWGFWPLTTLAGTSVVCLALVVWFLRSRGGAGH